ncbi:MAG: sigma 54-interacting transcriptional regulator [Deltaproteobacteria bacterium]|nr:sigma 54-interacting transcriptional regulator [Deltaproteobacteria bacterium]MBW1910604.1 sigma 54-interacting transcriptional regulator [Deltaproteobacteria bacterium]MBW2034985.1 sigma 54-interacting transcriptional regulator [Deltaproteobacteria bacterium]MBW2115288.1 sigma 54-interacting transcriptional regulator [Deltaproteobacteria bacterium]
MSAIVAFQITQYYVKKGIDSSLAILLWVLIAAAIAFLIGLVIARLLLGPVKRFMQKVKEFPALSSLEIESGKLRQVDELKYFAQIFDQVTDVLGNVDARQLFPDIIGESGEMRRLLSKLMMVAPTNSTVLILGEPGTGKNLVAKNIYEHSLRKLKPFIKVSCNDIPKKVLESELFGHKRDDSAGDFLHKLGQFEMANGGVIFFDEIGDIPLSTQAKILRVLQDGEFERVRDSKTIKVDVRFIAASNKNLTKLANEGRFNEDLYYRMNVFSLPLPPLRERKEDIPFLVDHFLQKSPKKAQVSSAALQLLMVYRWPGNVNELRETVERSAAICEDEIIEVRDLPQSIRIDPSQRAEAILQHAQRMESVGSIASGISHNFRNILSGITVNNQLIQIKYKDDAKLQEIAGSINKFVRRGSDLVNELMQFSRKQPENKLDILNLVEVLKETYNLITESFQKKIDIHMDVPESIFVLGTRSGLSQVFMNLCTNARDAMPEGGELRIEAKQNKDKVEVTIADTGTGMDSETLEKCFDPFFTTKDPGKGTGLGLSTIYGIIKNHGGDINITSELNKGTTFLLSFPLHTAVEEEKKQEDMTTETVFGDGQKVLIVDDETEVLKPMEDMLEGLGYSAASAESGKEAIAKYITWQPDIVLMDRNMPEMDGTKCAELIIEHDPDAKIVLISGYDEKGADGLSDQEKLLIKNYLTKPIDITKLSQILAQLFE